MSSCCPSHHHHPVFDGTNPAFRRALWIVIFLNAGMFVIETLFGHIGASHALRADALDFLGDTATYGLSLWAIGQSARTRARAAMAKGISLALMGVWVMGSTLYHFIAADMPSAPIMGVIGIMAFSANLLSVALLYRWQDGDANIRSVWLCSRNDAIGNLTVLLAGAAVWYVHAAWPDLLVATIMAGLFLYSASQIIRGANRELAHSPS